MDLLDTRENGDPRAVRGLEALSNGWSPFGDWSCWGIHHCPPTVNGDEIYTSH
jgi:hypothetical protein